MTTSKPSPSPVVPVLVAVLACDVACTDPATGKHTLVGIFDKVHVGKFPTSRPFSVYVKLTDAEGDYDFDFRFVQIGSGKTIMGAKGHFRVSDRVGSSSFIVQFPGARIPDPGRYEIQVWTNSVFLGATFIDAAARD